MSWKLADEYYLSEQHISSFIGELNWIFAVDEKCRINKRSYLFILFLSPNYFWIWVVITLHEVSRIRILFWWKTKTNFSEIIIVAFGSSTQFCFYKIDLEGIILNNNIGECILIFLTEHQQYFKIVRQLRKATTKIFNFRQVERQYHFYYYFLSSVDQLWNNMCFRFGIYLCLRYNFILYLFLERVVNISSLYFNTRKGGAIYFYIATEARDAVKISSQECRTWLLWFGCRDWWSLILQLAQNLKGLHTERQAFYIARGLDQSSWERGRESSSSNGCSNRPLSATRDAGASPSCGDKRPSTTATWAQAARVPPPAAATSAPAPQQ